jgi:four helix bundle protein
VDDFIAKLGIVEEETDESAYWLEMLADTGLVKPARLEPLQRECDEILAIIVATLRTAKRNRDR